MPPDKSKRSKPQAGRLADDPDADLLELQSAQGSVEVLDLSSAPDAKAKLIVNRESDSALIVAVDLPTPAEGQRYIVWMRFADGTDFANGGELRVDPDGGKATLMIQPFGGLARYEAVVITSEPIASTGGPSSPSLLTAVLGAP